MLAQSSYNALVHEGNDKFSQKKYAEAISQFKKATEINEKDFAASYNLGNALYKEKKFDEAIAEWSKAGKASKNKMDQSAVYHNIGNAYLHNNKPQKAAEFYKKALSRHRTKETLKNLQIAKRKEQQQKQQQQKRSGEKKKNSSEKNQQDAQQNKNGENDDDKGENQQNGKGGNQNKGKSDGQEQNDKNQDDTGENRKIPKEIEKAIMNRVANKERNTARRILNKRSNYTPESKEKDW